MRRVDAIIVLVSLLILAFAAGAHAQGGDVDAIPDAVQKLLGAESSTALQPLEVEIGGSGPTAPKITGISAAHVAADRYVFKITFEDTYPDDNTVFHLYVDADDDLATGRQDSEAHRGTDIMYSFVDGHSDPRIHNGAVRVDGSIPVRGVVDGKAIYVCDDVRLNTEGGEARFRISLRSHLRTDSGDSYGGGWTYVKIPREEGRELPPLPIPEADGFGWLTMPNFAELAWRVWEAEGTVRLRPEAGTTSGFTVLMSDDIAGDGEEGETITWRSPVSGSYHIGFVMREDGSRREGLDLRVGGELVGTTAGTHGSREVMHYTLDPVELEEGTEIAISSSANSSPVVFHSVHLAREAPRVPPLRISNLTAWHMPDEPGEAPGRIMVAWTTNRPTEASVRYRATAPAGGNAEGVLEGRGVVNNHYVQLPRDISGDAWDLEITCAEREQDDFEAQQVTETFTVHRDRAEHLAAHGEPVEISGETRQIQLTVREPTDAGRDGWPVRSGVPLPQGLLSDASAVRLLDASGAEVPVQAQATSWWPDGISVQWLLIDFLARTDAGSEAQYTLEVNAEPSVAAEQTVQVQAEEIAPDVAPGVVRAPVEVETGALTWRLGDGGFAPFADVTAPGRSGAEIAEDGGFELVDAEGTRFSSAHEAPEEIVVEQAGPLRATLRVRGRLVSEDGAAHMRYLCRLHFYAGSPAVRTVFSLENDVLEPRMNRIESLQVRVPADLEDAAFSVGADGDALEIEQGDRLLQDEDFRFAVGDDTGHRADGWVLARRAEGALAVAVRDFWQLYPKGLTADADGLTLELLPALPDDIYADADENELTQWYFWADEGRYTLSTGVRITTDFAVDFAPAVDEQAPERYVAGQWWSNRLFAAATPEYYCSTGTLDALVPREEGKFDIFEGELDEAFEGFMALQESEREFGFMNYGDWFGERTWNWGNNEYDTAWGLAANFVRTGNLEMLERAYATAGHSADIDTVHYHEDPSRVGYQYAHSIGHTGGFFDEDWKGMSASYNRGALNRSGHLWTQGQFALYALTGEERLLETGRKMARMVADNTTDFRYYNERTFGWPIISLMGGYNVDPDPRYLNGAKLMADAAVWTLHPDKHQWGARINPRECRHDPRPEGPCWGSKPFMTGVGLRSLSMYHRAQPREEVQRTMVRNSGWMWEVGYLPEYNGFIYSECPSHSTRGSTWTMSLVGAGLAYAGTLDAERRYADRLEQAAHGFFYEAGPREFGKSFSQSTAFLPAMLHDLDALGLSDFPERPQYGAMLIDLPDGPPAVGETSEGRVVMRAPAEQSVRGTLSLSAHDHFRIEPSEMDVNVRAGERAGVEFTVIGKSRPALFARVVDRPLVASFDGEGALATAEMPLRVKDVPLEGVSMTQAADFVAQEGGEVMMREDKVGDLDTSISHWNDEGHALTWQMTVPEAGSYLLALRYCAPHDGLRNVGVDGHGEFAARLAATGGYSSDSSDWWHEVVRDEDGAPRVFELEAGEVTVTATNADGNGLNLDYLALVPADG
ncbi:MAG: hypothetical protein R6V07_19170 [Armatimonadota bacterium]